MFFLSLLLLLSSQCVYAVLPDDVEDPVEARAGLPMPPPPAMRPEAPPQISDGGCYGTFSKQDVEVCTWV